MSDQNFNLHMISMKNERKHVLSMSTIGQNYQTKCQREFRRTKFTFVLYNLLKVKIAYTLLFKIILLVSILVLLLVLLTST